MNKTVRAAKRVLPVYAQTTDAWAKGVVEGDENVKVSCKKGCDGCCHQLTKAMLAEGAVVAVHLMEQNKFEKYRPKLEAMARLADDVEKGSDPTLDYLKSKTPCAFLENGQCSIYDVRPAACRTYFVTSDPANCSPNVPGAAVLQVDPAPVMSVFFSKLLADTENHIPALVGPFASVVLAGFELVNRGPSSFRRWAAKSPLFTENQ